MTIKLTVEAVKFDGDNMSEVSDFVGIKHYYTKDDTMYIGELAVPRFHYIVRNLNGAYYVVPPKNLEQELPTLFPDCR